MEKTIITAAAILAVLIGGTATLSAQEAKKVEKKMVVVTVEDDGIKKTDTTIITTDTLVFDEGDLIIRTREGNRTIRKPGERSRMIWIENEGGFPPPVAEPGMRPARAIQERFSEKEGVSYNISVDGVVVNIRAPREKTKEADKILEEVKKILMTR
ncbi:MAG: hypothetical protein R2756_00580 [Bacteroidales bacterium]